MSGETALSLRSFGVAFGDRTVLSDVTLDLPRTGLTTLVGPAGSGKSTLLRTVAGLNDAHPALSTWGSVSIAGDGVHGMRSVLAGEVRNGVGFVMQHARFFLDSVRENLVSALPNRAWLDPASQTRIVTGLLQASGLGQLVPRLDEDVVSLPTPVQRRLALVRALAPDPVLLLADEPTAGLDEDDAVDLLTLLRLQAHFRSVLFVTHNQRYARAAGGNVMLLAGGRIQEVAPSREFFDEPSTASARSFVRTGGCAEASPNARPEDLRSSSPPSMDAARPRAVKSRFEGPRGFFWVWPGRLGGLPRPGIVAAVEQDMEGLQRLGVSTLVSLEETRTVDPSLLEARGIASVHCPIADMGVPEHAAAEALCRLVDQRIRAGEVVALHCRAGLGRTGTLLACQLVFGGESARGAIERIRRLNPACIQSQQQVDFLSSFELLLRERRVAGPPLAAS